MRLFGRSWRLPVRQRSIHSEQCRQGDQQQSSTHSKQKKKAQASEDGIGLLGLLSSKPISRECSSAEVAEGQSVVELQADFGCFSEFGNHPVRTEAVVRVGHAGHQVQMLRQLPFDSESHVRTYGGFAVAQVDVRPILHGVVGGHPQDGQTNTQSWREASFEESELVAPSEPTGGNALDGKADARTKHHDRAIEATDRGERDVLTEGQQRYQFELSNFALDGKLHACGIRLARIENREAVGLQLGSNTAQLD